MFFLRFKPIFSTAFSFFKRIIIGWDIASTAGIFAECGWRLVGDTEILRCGLPASIIGLICMNVCETELASSITIVFEVFDNK